ncbi:hypothetical protein Nepgr_019409 [Nepenthes gracilis]|uniref:Uncharacterized protein n=1 Tax=Nepenthes gracilis TaxID=150966 RepID=A0AAD3STD6_NEPGR|nr:hypothetical protein Nepgr_019409 [Nepenthes gracilis]
MVKQVVLVEAFVTMEEVKFWWGGGEEARGGSASRGSGHWGGFGCANESIGGGAVGGGFGGGDSRVC